MLEDTTGHSDSDSDSDLDFAKRGIAKRRRAAKKLTGMVERYHIETDLDRKLLLGVLVRDSTNRKNLS